ncbi:hypothetical protein QWZ13_14585 [Reinekea marina]|uniref:hypothetical protein n=1 Tax=Reinekea marina TaxID=1310421 RepID=UPI0025B610CF|nr:hypothetical protein [Reinekea marina]MDN3650144.1 hypothetical protein [Reinekea marina]
MASHKSHHEPKCAHYHEWSSARAGLIDSYIRLQIRLASICEPVTAYVIVFSKNSLLL